MTRHEQSWQNLHAISLPPFSRSSREYFCKRAREILLQKGIWGKIFNEFLIYFEAISLARESPNLNNVNFHFIYDICVDIEQTNIEDLFE